MAFVHGTDPSGTPICSSQTWAELFTATNEKENHMGYTTETAWSNGSARPAPGAFIGQPRHVVLGIGAGENIKLLRDVLDTTILEHDVSVGFFPRPTLFTPIEDIAGWTPYAGFADLYNTALGAGTDWETATVDLGERPQGDNMVIKEMLSIDVELKAFQQRLYFDHFVDNTIVNGFAISSPPPINYTTEAAAYAAAIANGVQTAVRTVCTYGMLWGIDDVLFYQAEHFFLGLQKLDAATGGGPDDPAPTTLEGAYGYTIGNSQDAFAGFPTMVNCIIHLRESNVAEYTSPNWTADEAIPLVSVVATGAVTPTVISSEFDALIIGSYASTKYFRLDQDDVNYFSGDPQTSKATWIAGTLDEFGLDPTFIGFRYASTNWTYE